MSPGPKHQQNIKPNKLYQQGMCANARGTGSTPLTHATSLAQCGSSQRLKSKRHWPAIPCFRPVVQARHHHEVHGAVPSEWVLVDDAAVVVKGGLLEAVVAVRGIVKPWSPPFRMTASVYAPFTLFESSCMEQDTCEEKLPQQNGTV